MHSFEAKRRLLCLLSFKYFKQSRILGDLFVLTSRYNCVGAQNFVSLLKMFSSIYFNNLLGVKTKRANIDGNIGKLGNIEQLLDEVFVIPGIIKVVRLRLIALTSTLINPDITKTESNNCFNTTALLKMRNGEPCFHFAVRNPCMSLTFLEIMHSTAHSLQIID